MERIGYIDKSKLDLIKGVITIEDLSQMDIHFDDRDIVEDRSDVVQPVCAGVIMTKDNKILTVNKNPKSTGETSPEKDKTLLYLGGHLDVTDSNKSKLQTFINGMKREIGEETGVVIGDDNISTPIIAYDPATEKSAKHLGVIFPILIEKSFDISFSDGECKFVDINKLDNITNFNSWSELVLEEIVKKFYINEI